MNPYYQDDYVTIYHSDNRYAMNIDDEWLVTDPPYTGLKGGVVSSGKGVAASVVPYTTIGERWGDSIKNLKELTMKCRTAAMVFCSWQNVCEIPSLIGGEKVCLVTWAKRNTQPSRNNAPYYQTEFVWCVKYNSDAHWRKLKTFYEIPNLQAGCMATERITLNGKAKHPTQKPLKLMKELMVVCSSTVLDPYMGTGTTLKAAKDMGIEAIGFEQEERYCEIAAQRLSQEVLDF